MKPKELIKLGVSRGVAMELGVAATRLAGREGLKKGAIKQMIRRVLADPEFYIKDNIFGELAAGIIKQTEDRSCYSPRSKPAPYRKWGEDLESGAVTQMENACSLSVAVRGALMPDAHLGYGLPIGGVLATKGVVIPYAVGVDIACRMRLSVIDWPVSMLERKRRKLIEVIEKETGFGVGVSFKVPRQHGVMDEDWSFSSVTKKLKDRAWSQLGTSGSGNHFVEFGTLEIDGSTPGLEAGLYLALLSHSGSRGAGASIAKHFSKLATERHTELPNKLKHLAWLDLKKEEGEEYWRSMELMGRYAAAGHQLIHKQIVDRLGVQVLSYVENHHNFAWKEKHDGVDVIVHRKGATPAAKGTLGVIPGSMASPCYVSRGKGNADSLNSSSHGAGRRMSRKAALARFDQGDLDRVLRKRGVKLLSAALDEVPMAYKDIDEVMAAQRELTEPVGRFDPKIVKMAS